LTKNTNLGGTNELLARLLDIEIKSYLSYIKEEKLYNKVSLKIEIINQQNVDQITNVSCIYTAC
jgi:hypothetical protein